MLVRILNRSLFIPADQCGTPCACLSGIGGKITSPFACWAVREPDPANPGTFKFTCYRDYGIDGGISHLEDVCCTGGCGDPFTGVNWTISAGTYQCTRAEACTEAIANNCAGKVGF